MDSWFITYISTQVPELTVTLPIVGLVDLTAPVVSLLVFTLLTIAFIIVQSVVLVRLRALSAKTSSDVDDVLIGAVSGIRPFVYILVAGYVALQLFALPTAADLAVTGVVYFVVVWQIVEMAVKFVDYGAKRFLEKDEDGDGEVDPGSATASNMVGLMARIVLWALGGLFVLSNLGIEVTSLIAGLGIGGIAVAFALQGILSDLFASFSIYFDRPFRIGDYIVIGADSGTVEKIGIKSTRIRTLQGEELVVSNAELTTARVQNFKKMQERRIVTQIGVTYDTDQENVELIPKMVTEIFGTLTGGRLDRVHFTTFGDSALIFDIVYYVESSEYSVFLDIQQAFNVALLKQFAQKGIEFAYPSQTIYHKQVG